MRRILAILLLLALLCGCTGQGIPAGENQLTFYYRRADGTNDESFASETGALTEKRVTLGGDVSVEEVLEAYLQPPEDEGLVSLFPDGTICTGTKLQKGVLTLEMNEMYASLTGYARTLAAAGLTMTLTQLDSVDAVQIRTPSGALLGRASMRWTRDSFLLQDTSWLYPERTVQLLSGPESDQLQSPVPAGTKLLDVRVTGTLCTAVLSEEFSACDTGREAASLAVRSVVATLCALSEIEQVQLQLQSGEDLVYCSIAQPLKPEWSWYN